MRGTHVDGKDTILVEPGADNKCLYCVKPSSWYQSINGEIALHVCGEEANACKSSKDQCDSLRREAETQSGMLAKRVQLLDSTYQGQGFELKLCKSQKDLKDSIASSYSAQLVDERKLVNTWRWTAFGLLAVAVAEGFLLYWTNK